MILAPIKTSMILECYISKPLASTLLGTQVAIQNFGKAEECTMSLFDWNEKFSVSDEKMDYQHKHFLNLLNKLNDAILQKNGSELVESAVNSIYSYAHFHFRDEEDILMECGYPDLGQHRRFHHYFVKQVLDLEESCREGSPIQLSGIVSFLRDWFIDHITLEDKKYARYVKGYHADESLFLRTG